MPPKRTKKAKRPSPDNLVSRGVPRLPNEPRWDVASFDELTVPELESELKRCGIEPPERGPDGKKIKYRKRHLVGFIEEHYNNLDATREVYITPLLDYLNANRRSTRYPPVNNGLAIRRFIETDGTFHEGDLTALQESFDVAKRNNDCDSWYGFIEGLFDTAQGECEGWEKKYVLISNDPGRYWERTTEWRADLKPDLWALERGWSRYQGIMTEFMGPGGTRNREFRQHDAGGSGECLWLAFAHAYWGNAELWQRVRYDAAVVFNYGRLGRGNRHVENFGRDYTRRNSVNYLRTRLYQALVEDSDIVEQLFGEAWGTDHALQLIADAYGVQIFAHVPTHDIPGKSMNWGVRIYGDNDPPRGQIHLINWTRLGHWTALMPVRPNETAGRTDDYPETCSFSVATAHADTQPLVRVAPGYPDRATIARGAPIDITNSNRTPADSEANYKVMYIAIKPGPTTNAAQGAKENLPGSAKEGSKRPNNDDAPGPSSSNKKQKTT